MGLIHSLENYLFREIELSIQDRRNLLAFVGIMCAVDMIMRNLFDRANKEGFQYFCTQFLAKRNKKYGDAKNIEKLWKLRVALTHNWGTKHLYYLLPDLSLEEAKKVSNPRLHSHMVEIAGAFYFSVPQLFDDVKIVLFNDVYDVLRNDENLQRDANKRFAKLF